MITRKGICLLILVSVTILKINLSFAYNLTDGQGFTYTFSDGYGQLQTISGTGYSDPINYSFYPIFNGSYAYHCCSSTFEDNGREWVSGVDIISGIELTKKVFVPENGNFIRQMIIMENVSGSVQNNITFQMRIDLRTSYTINETSDNDASLETTDRWAVITPNGYSPVAFNWYGPGGDTIDYQSNQTTRTYRRWDNLDFSVGETKVIIVFTVPQVNSADAITRAQAVDAGTDLEMFDGLSSFEISNTINWTFPDSDGDLMPDVWELANGFNPAVDDSALDSDSDGLSNIAEYLAGSDPLDTDTDGDGISDGDEVNIYGSNPVSTESDGDGISDALELELGFDPADPTSGNNLLYDPFVSNGESLALDTGTLVHFENVTEANLPADAISTLPTGNFIYGFYRLVVNNIVSGTTVVVSITMPTDVPIGAKYLKWDATAGWYEVAVGSDDGDDYLEIYLTDGGIGDADGEANGIIVDPGGFGLGVSLAAGGGAGGAGSGGDTTQTNVATETYYGCSMSPVDKPFSINDLWFYMMLIMLFTLRAYRQRFN